MLRLGPSLAITGPIVACGQRAGVPPAAEIELSAVSFAAGVFSVSVENGPADTSWLVSASGSQMTGLAIEAAVAAETPEAFGAFTASSGTSDHSIDLSGVSAGTRYLHVAARKGGTVKAAVPFEFVYEPPPTLQVVRRFSSVDYSFNTTSQITIPAEVAVGSRLIFFVAWGADRTRTPPAGVSEEDYIAASSDGGGLGVYEMTDPVASGQPGSTLTWDSSAAVKGAIIGIEVAGSTGNLQVAKQNASRNPSSITPAPGEREYLILAADAYKGVYTNAGVHAFTGPPSGYGDFTLAETDSAINGSGGDRTLAVAAKIVTAATEDPGTFSTFGAWVDPNCYQTLTVAVW